MLYVLLFQIALLLFLPGTPMPGEELSDLVSVASAQESVFSVPSNTKPVIGSLPRASDLVRPPEKVRPESVGVEVTAQSALVVDGATGAALFEKDPDAAHPLASLTKLAAALVALDTRPEWTAEVTILPEDVRGGSIEYFIPGEAVTFEELLAASLVGSSNTATAALARATGLGSEEFVARMNGIASALGLAQTRFVEPTGLDQGNVGTAREVAALARRAFAEPMIRKYATTQQVTIRPKNAKNNRLRVIRSTDELLSSFLARAPYAIYGGKTGSWGGQTGYHFTLSVAKDAGKDVIVTVLGSASDAARFSDAKALAAWTFETYRWE